MHCVDVKYRSNWDVRILNEVEDQTKLMGKLTLVCFNANPNSSSSQVSGGTHLRACVLKHKNGTYMINKYQDQSFTWSPVSHIAGDPDAWFRLAPIQYVFEKLVPSEGLTETPLKAVRAIESLMKNF